MIGELGNEVCLSGLQNWRSLVGQLYFVVSLSLPSLSLTLVGFWSALRLFSRLEGLFRFSRFSSEPREILGPVEELQLISLDLFANRDNEVSEEGSEHVTLKPVDSDGQGENRPNKR